jgi:hypothetical protein
VEYKTNKLIGVTQFSEYMTGSILLGFSWAFCLPFIQGLLASMDSHGSAVAAVSGASTIGGAAWRGRPWRRLSSEPRVTRGYFILPWACFFSLY